MKKWLRKRTNQVTILLSGIIILIFSNLIIPTYEKIPYYNKNISKLKKTKKQLARYALHMEYHENNYLDVRQKLEELETQILQPLDTVTLQNRLGKMQRGHHLKVKTQKLETQNIDDFFSQVVIKQTLEGNYQNQIGYLKDLLDHEDSLIMTRCDFKNLEPISKDPTLLADLELKYFVFSP